MNSYARRPLLCFKCKNRMIDAFASSKYLLPLTDFEGVCLESYRRPRYADAILVFKFKCIEIVCITNVMVNITMFCMEYC